MGNNWEPLNLGDIVEIKTGKLDSNHASELGEYPFFTCAPNPLKIDSYAFDAEAILLAGNNANGIFHLNLYKGKFNAYQRTYVLTIKDENRSNLRFLYYSLKTVTQKLGTYSLGTATKFLTMKILSPLEIPSPPLPEQKAIAHILGSLDDKIELNRRMNATLEGMAQALFKSWFVDFDPVIDNAIKAGNPIPDELADRAEVRRQALANGTANREAAKPFPDSFHETEELGWIPEGWEVLLMPEVTTFREGPGILAKDFHERGVPLIRLAGLKSGVSLLDGCNFLDPDKVESKWSQFRLLKGDILLSSSASLGRVAEVDDEAVGTIPYTGIIGFRPIEKRTLQRYIHHYLTSSHFQSQVIMVGAGSVLNHFGPTHLKKMNMLIPTLDVQNAFSEIVDSQDKAQYRRLRQSDTLSKLRDTLLPKLISGELRIPKPKQLTGKALA
jgi:type I restriction enzyme S subunit